MRVSTDDFRDEMEQKALSAMIDKITPVLRDRLIDYQKMGKRGWDDSHDGVLHNMADSLKESVTEICTSFKADYGIDDEDIIDAICSLIILWNRND